MEDKEYIERNSLLDEVKQIKGAFTVPLIIRKIEEAPIEDVVEVVRCRACKYSDTVASPITGTERLYCDFGAQPVYVKDTHFCGYGKKKEGVN